MLVSSTQKPMHMRGTNLVSSFSSLLRKRKKKCSQYLQNRLGREWPRLRMYHNSLEYICAAATAGVALSWCAHVGQGLCSTQTHAHIDRTYI